MQFRKILIALATFVAIGAAAVACTRSPAAPSVSDPSAPAHTTIVKPDTTGGPATTSADSTGTGRGGFGSGGGT